MNVIAMTVLGRQDLTDRCLKTAAETIGDEIVKICLVDAGEGRDKTNVERLYASVANSGIVLMYVHKPACGISDGWNTAMGKLSGWPDVNCWVLNNDVEFRKAGWLKLLEDRLRVPGTGMVGCYGMSVFGWPFVTGGIWGFRLDAVPTEGGKILDERFNYSLQEVDLSIRLAKMGYAVTHVPGLEHGDDPYLVHGISQTGLSLHGSEVQLRKLREPERRAFIDKWGRKDGKEGYEGVVE